MPRPFWALPSFVEGERGFLVLSWPGARISPGIPSAGRRTPVADVIGEWGLVDRFEWTALESHRD